MYNITRPLNKTMSAKLHAMACAAFEAHVLENVWWDNALVACQWTEPVAVDIGCGWHLMFLDFSAMGQSATTITYDCRAAWLLCGEAIAFADITVGGNNNIKARNARCSVGHDGKMPSLMLAYLCAGDVETLPYKVIHKKEDELTQLDLVDGWQSCETMP